MGRRGGGNGSGRWFIFDRWWAGPVESEWGLGGRDKFQSQLFLMMCQVWWLQKRMGIGGGRQIPIATIFDDVVGAVVTKKSYWFDSNQISIKARR